LADFRPGDRESAALSTSCSPTDNVWAIDCSSLFPSTVSRMEIHGAYFMIGATINLMRQVLKGLDRDVLVDRKIAPPPKL
jgi:hypothetical protein